MRRDFGKEGRGCCYSGLQRVVAVVRVRWHCNAARGFVRGLPAEPLDTSRRNKVQKEQGEGKETQAEPVAKHRKKNNVAESGRKRQKRGAARRDRRARTGKKRRVKIERDREFGKVHVSLNAVCANVTAFKVEYIARVYPRYTRSSLRLTRVTYIRKLYSNRGMFSLFPCVYVYAYVTRENVVINLAYTKA